ncbi:2-hydroxyglutaryl-CoA dehydratase [Sesbania bispinosa]|nr:2-hydroxyglutaryl-CoA dehydratase [Sesbania bispinosa]
MAVLVAEKKKKGGDGQRLTLVAVKGKIAAARTAEVQICGGGVRKCGVYSATVFEEGREYSDGGAAVVAAPAIRGRKETFLLGHFYLC